MVINFVAVFCLLFVIILLHIIIIIIIPTLPGIRSTLDVLSFQRGKRAHI